MMNSLYGKFAQRQNQRWQPVDPESTEYSVMFFPDGIERFEAEFEGVEREYWRVNETELYSYTLDDLPPLARASVCSIAGYITARGRSVLWKALKEVLDVGGTLYMCDTDSIVADCSLPDSAVSSTDMGLFKLEETSPGKETRFYAPKHYFMGGD